MENKTIQRQYDLDWIRVLATLAVFLYHCSMFFNPWPWHVKNNQLNYSGILVFSLFTSSWIMPIFFAVSGISVVYTLKKRSAGAYFKERFIRLGVPLLLGVFILSPPQVFIERLTHNQFSGSFLDFIPHYFDGVYLSIGGSGNFAFIGLHLWYLLVLLVYSFLTFPFFKKVDLLNLAVDFRSRRSLSAGVPGSLLGADAPAGSPQPRTPAGVERLPLQSTELKKSTFSFNRTPKIRKQRSFKPIHLFILPLFLVLIGPIKTVNLGGWDLLFYLVLFVYGYYFFSDSEFKSVVKKTIMLHFSLAIVTSIVYISWFMMGSPKPGSFADIIFYAIRTVNCWSWMLGIFYLADRYLTASNRFLAYGSEASMPFYVIHQPVIVLLGFGIYDSSLPVAGKALLLIGASFSIIMVCYHMGIRRTKFIRVLFGMKAQVDQKLVTHAVEMTRGGSPK
ncbi:acyltransferase family protein [Neobacillus dielmonensis]|uniref:acyltransferase family protein n=1 Tax=Neobacillus dielmonensis TaxID=1347369 RepID=UPI000B01F516|nr:acyltransferase family protein [Neobacillus dielmonensis]